MYYRVQLEQADAALAMLVTFGKETPTELVAAAEYADQQTGGEGKLGNSHRALMKNGKLIQIQINNAPQEVPSIDIEDPQSAMPRLGGILFGDPPAPALLILLTDSEIKKMTAYAIGPNVYLVYDDQDHLARIYVTNAEEIVEGFLR